MWYSAQEFQAIREGAIRTVKTMMKNLPIDNDPNHCTRGLEGKTPKQNKARQERKADVLWTVLSLQAENHGRDYEASCHVISKSYSECSRPFVLEALKTGCRDAVEAWGAPCLASTSEGNN
jgi:hypothetical protein